MSENHERLALFDVKYTEFAQNLLEVVPELKSKILSAMALKPAQRLALFKARILPLLKPETLRTVRTVLPGVTLTESVWTSLGETGQKAITEFLGVLAICCTHNSEEQGDLFMNYFKNAMSSVDFESLGAKLAGIFETKDSEDGKFPKIPERLLKGQLGKLVDEIFHEFKPEEFGFTPEMMATAEKDPAAAFKMITDMFTKNPDVFKAAMKRIISRLQDKIRRGQFKPQEIAKEIEELLKEFTENSEFKELLESFKDAFGFDEDTATGRATPEDVRRTIVRERLRKKVAAKKGGSSQNSR